MQVGLAPNRFSTMRSRPLDTDRAAWAAQNAALDRMDGSARLHAALELSDAVREIRLAGIRSRYPRASREETVRRLILEEYGVRLPNPRYMPPPSDAMEP